jgi:NADH:ubiquinone oxidoreductase subunit K
MIIFFLVIKKSSEDYTLILNVLILITCERAIGFSLLVILVRRFRGDKLVVNNNKKCEGF